MSMKEHSIYLCDARYNAEINLTFYDYDNFEYFSKNLVLSIEYTFKTFAKISDEYYKNNYVNINFYYKMFQDLLVTLNDTSYYKNNKKNVFEQYEKIFSNIVDEIGGK